MPDFVPAFSKYRTSDLYTLVEDEAFNGYLVCAAFADGPEGKTVRGFTKNTRRKALHDVSEFIQTHNELVVKALAFKGYDATKLGYDLWFSGQGHGTGFPDRDELDEATAIALHKATKKFFRSELCLFHVGGGFYEIC